MALIVGRTPATDTADDAIQVVDLDDIVTGSIDDRPEPPAHLRRRRRVLPQGVGRRARLAGAVGLVLLLPIVATVLYVQRESGSRVDTEDGRPPGELPLPGGNPEQPSDDVVDPPRQASADTAPDGIAPPETAPAASTTTASSTTTTVPPTTAATTTTVSDTLPDGSPNPLGPGPGGTSTGSTTTMPDPNGPDYSVPG